MTPDGATVAISSDYGTIRVWDRKTMKQTASLRV